MVDSYVVVGGEGFLGGNMVRMLLERHPQAAVASFDLAKRHQGRHTFEHVDLTDLEALTSALKRVGATCVFHTAASHIGAGPEISERINVGGTRTVIEACRRAGVRKLIYTSSAGAFFDGTDNINIDERLPYPDLYKDPYNLTKAKAEKMVLDANGQDGLLTCSIRPASIFGPGDSQATPGIMRAFKAGKNGIIIGHNENVVDWTYVDNIVYAHLLAADRLDATTTMAIFDERQAGVDASLNVRPVPTSISRPDGRWLPFETPVKGGAPDPPLPAMRNRLDQFYTDPHAPQPTMTVAGQAFFITNGEPIFFWDFVRALFYAYNGFDNAQKAFHLPASLAVIFATFSELYARLVGKEADFSVPRVYFMRAVRYHNIERARSLLGYEPIVGLAEGVRRTMEWYKATEASPVNG